MPSTLIHRYTRRARTGPRTFDRALVPLQQRAVVGRLSSPGARQDGLFGGLAIGAGIGLIWAPCVGPIMAAVIAAAVVSGPSPLAAAIAAAYVAGAVIPLAAIARWGRRATGTAMRAGRSISKQSCQVNFRS